MSESSDDETQDALPCQWCGEETQEIETRNEIDSRGVVYVARVECECGVCGPWSGGFIDEADAMSEAVTEWNEFAE